MGLPNSTMYPQTIKDTIASRIATMPSIESVNPTNLKTILGSVEGMESFSHRETDIPNAKLEEVFRDTMKNMKHISKETQDKKPDQHQFAEQFLKSLPEVVNSSSLPDRKLLDGLLSLSETLPENGEEMKERLGICSSVDIEEEKYDKNLTVLLKNMRLKPTTLKPVTDISSDSLTHAIDKAKSEIKKKPLDTRKKKKNPLTPQKKKKKKKKKS